MELVLELLAELTRLSVLVELAAYELPEDEEELGDMLLVGRSVAGWAVAAGIEMVVGGGRVVDVCGVGENSFKASKSLMTDCIIWYSFF